MVQHRWPQTSKRRIATIGRKIMRTSEFRKRCAYPIVLSVLLVGLTNAARAEDLPSYMEPIGGRTTSSAASIATRDMLALNARMFQQAGVSFSTVPAWSRSTRRRYRSLISS
jgi:hypothetical protein